jgi:sortase A
MRYFGNFLICASIALTVKTFFDPILAEVKYFIDHTLVAKKYVIAEDTDKPTYYSKGEDDHSVAPPSSRFAQLFNISQIERMVPMDPNFSIVIPKIAANARVISDVDVTNENEYLEKLKVGVAHARGTYLPGSGGHIFLFAHSTDYIWNVGTYNAVFYLLYKLEPGDEITLVHEGKRHVYVMEGSEVVTPDRVEYLTRQTEGEYLTLQTCWPPGTTLKRLLIFARPKVR